MGEETDKINKFTIDGVHIFTVPWCGHCNIMKGDAKNAKYFRGKKSGEELPNKGKTRIWCHVNASADDAEAWKEAGFTGVWEVTMYPETIFIKGGHWKKYDCTPRLLDQMVKDYEAWKPTGGAAPAAAAAT